jgi:undecaprenyl diphosphate synthase
MAETKVTLPKGTIIPNHIAIILDGNGRWARSHGLPVTKGHEAGAEALKKLIRSTREWGIHTLTVWGFSTENWKRPPAEKKKIFELVAKTIKESIEEAKEEGVRFVHIGRKDRLPKELIQMILKAESETRNNNKHILNVALDYGGRDEILRAVRKLVDDKIPSEKIDEDLFSSYLDLGGQPFPNPDLFIRTSGEMRTSGYLPWQMVYTEFYFVECHLPDVDSERLKEAILDFSRRRRRFGAKDKVVHFKFSPSLAAKLELNWWRLRKIPEGMKLREYAILHLKEQFGFSKTLAAKAAKLLVKALLFERQKDFVATRKILKQFYELVRDELKLAFEPELVASLELKMRRELDGKNDIEDTFDAEKTAQELFAEVYRISLFQAAKLAHLRVLATVERNLAERGFGEKHWDKAEDYLEKFYSALKERIA